MSSLSTNCCVLGEEEGSQSFPFYAVKKNIAVYSIYMYTQYHLTFWAVICGSLGYSVLFTWNLAVVRFLCTNYCVLCDETGRCVFGTNILCMWYYLTFWANICGSRGQAVSSVQVWWLCVYCVLTTVFWVMSSATRSSYLVLFTYTLVTHTMHALLLSNNLN